MAMMKRLLFLVVVLAFIGWGEAYADYSFNFMSNDGTYKLDGTLITPSNGKGPITPSGGSATGTGGLINGVIYSLVPAPIPPANSIRPFRGTDLIFDNQLFPGSDPVLDGNGLVFKASDGSSYLNIWGNGPSNYTVFYLSASVYGGGTPTGNVTLTPVTPTPIPAAFWLLGSGLVGLVGIRRRFKTRDKG
jgi:xanthosine utilization system XapX-like protein